MPGASTTSCRRNGAGTISATGAGSFTTHSTSTIVTTGKADTAGGSVTVTTAVRNPGTGNTTGNIVIGGDACLYLMLNNSMLS